MDSEHQDTPPQDTAQAGQVLADALRAAAQPSPAFSRHWATLDDQTREYVADVIAKSFIQQVRTAARQQNKDSSRALETYLQGIAKGPQGRRPST